MADEKGVLERTIDVYKNFEKDPSKIKEIKEFDELRQKQTQSQLETIGLLQDPADRHRQMAQVYQMIKQDTGYFVGREKYAGKFDDMPISDQIQMYTTLGVQAIDDKIDPTHRLRRR